MKKRFTEEQLVRMLCEAETSGMQIREFCGKQNITEQTFFRWRNKYGGMHVVVGLRTLRRGNCHKWQYAVGNQRGTFAADAQS